jgi:hypothetical protein
VLDAVAELAGWGEPLELDAGRGIAIAESFGTIAAHVVEVSMVAGGPRVRRVSAVIDCGTVVHPDTARQQVEGAIIMGLSAATREEITLSDGAVVSRVFATIRSSPWPTRRASTSPSWRAWGHGAGSANPVCHRPRQRSPMRSSPPPVNGSGRSRS